MTNATPLNQPTDLNDARIISNSEVSDFLTCERKHLFSFGYSKESKHPSDSLTTGILGHEVLAEIYRAIKGGASGHKILWLQGQGFWKLKGTFIYRSMMIIGMVCVWTCLLSL